MILKSIAEMMGGSLPKFKCAKCREDKAEIMWQGLALSETVRYKTRQVEGELYLCKGCAVDVCCGILRDVAEINKKHDNTKQMELLDEIYKAFEK